MLSNYPTGDAKPFLKMRHKTRMKGFHTLSPSNLLPKAQDSEGPGNSAHWTVRFSTNVKASLEEGKVGAGDGKGNVCGER